MNTTSTTLRYALLVGQGRSGTTYLSDLINQSPVTHTRNEPEQTPGSALHRIADQRFFVDDPSKLERLWDDSIHQAAMKLGPRDFMSESPKDWLFPGTRELGHQYIALKYRVGRRLFDRGTRPMNNKEVGYPIWMTTTARLEKTVHVFKLNAAVGLAVWMLQNRPDGKVIHLVRHPGGFANSWNKRVVQGKSWHAENQKFQGMSEGIQGDLNDAQRLAKLAAESELWADRLGDIEGMNRAERELWWWRYCNERLNEVGKDNPNYAHFLFEDLSRDPAGTTERIFEFCDLPWNEWLGKRMEEMSMDSAQISTAWRDKIDAELLETVERVTDGCPLLPWWE